MKTLDSAIARIEAITWEEDESKVDLHLTFMCEYLRRMALWCKTLGISQNWIFHDLSYIVHAPTVLDEAEINAVTAKLRHGIAVYRSVVNVCRSYLRWQAINGPQIEVLYNLPAPYEPAIRTIEQGGSFRVAHDDFLEIDFPTLAMPLRSQDYYAQHEPYIDINP